MVGSRWLAVLDVSRGQVIVLDPDTSTIQYTIKPAMETCGRLRQPEAITEDRANNVYVADTGNQRVLRFSANTGTFSCYIMDCCAGSSSDNRLAPRGLSVTPAGHLVVVLSGEKQAEIQILTTS